MFYVFGAYARRLAQDRASNRSPGYVIMAFAPNVGAIAAGIILYAMCVARTLALTPADLLAADTRGCIPAHADRR